MFSMLFLENFNIVEYNNLAFMQFFAYKYQ